MINLLLKKNRGFTLIELLVVIAIIGILSSIVLVSMNGAKGSARDATRKSDMRQIITAQEMYYGASDVYFTDSGATWPAAIGTYLSKTPVDPGVNTYIWIDNASNDQAFCVYATLENGDYYAASPTGHFICSDAVPTLDDCCF